MALFCRVNRTTLVYFELSILALLQNTLIICFKIKNPPKYNRQRRQLLFLVCLQVSEKSAVMKENC
jgi:hypothetical protein